MKQSDFPENLVWHYTTGHGLLGIVTNHVLWAISALFLNDSNAFDRASCPRSLLK